jgi:hypothetical protein
VVQRIRYLGPLLFAILGCGSSEGPHCAARSGVYKVEFGTSTGTCQQFEPQQFTLDPTGQAAPSTCTAHEEAPAADNCSALLKVGCPAGSGYELLLSGTISWTEDGTRGSGTVHADIQKADGTYPCTSTYQTTYTRQ